MQQGLRHDNRGQSMTYIVAGGTIILFAAIYAVFQTPAEKLLTTALENCTTETCETGVGHVLTAWTWSPLIAAGLVVIMIIAASIFKSRSPV